VPQSAQTHQALCSQWENLVFERFSKLYAYQKRKEPQMSRNISKEKRESLLAKIGELRNYLRNTNASREMTVYLTELEVEVKRQKFGLVFEEHKEEIDEKLETHTPVLQEDKSLFINSGRTINFLIEGDNLAALTLLRKTHFEKLKVIYIDPPYNTGAKDWKYNNDYVGNDDRYRHSKWISFLKSRLVIAKELLADDGIICITIDDYELPNLWLLMDEIFGEDNNLGVATIRNNPKGRMTKTKLSQVHEYAIFYGRTQKAFIKKLPVMPEDKSHKYIKDVDGRYYVKVNLRKQGVDSEAIKPNGALRDRYFPIYFDLATQRISATEKLPIEILPIDNNGNKRIWRRSQEGVNKLYEAGDLFCTKIKNSYQIHFKFRGGLDGEVPKTIWYDSTFSASEYGTNIINEVLGREKFQYPKALPAVIYALKCCSDLDDVTVLDFFAGSGTTGHAVMEMNKEDGGTRQFILCTNNDNKICREVTFERIKRVIEKENYEASLKYQKIEFLPTAEQIYYDYADELLKHIKELVELENAINFDGNTELEILLTEEEVEKFFDKAAKLNQIKTIYLGHDVFLNLTQQTLLQNNGITVNIIHK